MIVQPVVEPMDRFTELVFCHQYQYIALWMATPADGGTNICG